MFSKKEPDFLQYPANYRIMHTHETMVDLISRRARPSTVTDSMSYGLLGSGFVVPFMGSYVNNYLDDRDEDYSYEGGKWKTINRVLSRSTLGCGALAPHPNIKQLTSEKAEQLARELIEEEERQKNKTEKKKKSKMRQRERKRFEKEHAIQVKGLLGEEPEMLISSGNEGMTKDGLSGMGVNQSHDPGPGGTPSTSHDLDSKKMSVCSEDEDEVNEFKDKEGSETEELDMASSFVSSVASIARKRLDHTPKLEKKKTSSVQPLVDQNKLLKHENKNYSLSKKPGKKHNSSSQPPPGKSAGQPPPGKKHNSSGQQPVEKINVQVQGNIEELVMKSKELALIGNQYAAHGHIEVAVKFFTDAIKLNPREYKLFGNRSLCYERLGQFERALVDAELALEVQPAWLKGLFRRAKALTGLKRYYDAAVVYRKLLRLEASCPEAALELHRVQTFQLMEMGFPLEQSEEALRAHATFEQALDALSGTKVRRSDGDREEEPLTEEWEAVVAPKRELGAAIPPPPATTTRPQLFPVWVGSVMPGVTEAGLHNLFSRAGPVHSVKLLAGQQCAFVNYTSREECESAIQLLNGREVGGACVSVRHPTNIHTSLGGSPSALTQTPGRAMKKSVGKRPQECFFWRTTGCVKRETCGLIHPPERRGVQGDRVGSDP